MKNQDPAGASRERQGGAHERDAPKLTVAELRRDRHRRGGAREGRADRRRRRARRTSRATSTSCSPTRRAARVAYKVQVDPRGQGLARALLVHGGAQPAVLQARGGAARRVGARARGVRGRRGAARRHAATRRRRRSRRARSSDGADGAGRRAGRRRWCASSRSPGVASLAERSRGAGARARREPARAQAAPAVGADDRRSRICWRRAAEGDDFDPRRVRRAARRLLLTARKLEKHLARRGARGPPRRGADRQDLDEEGPRAGRPALDLVEFAFLQRETPDGFVDPREPLRRRARAASTTARSRSSRRSSPSVRRRSRATPARCCAAPAAGSIPGYAPRRTDLEARPAPSSRSRRHARRASSSARSRASRRRDRSARRAQEGRVRARHVAGRDRVRHGVADRAAAARRQGRRRGVPARR